MPITPRRMEFLQKIVSLFHQTGLPVHYAEVAQALGVSKWTAYDILKELEKQDYLHSEYVLNRFEKTPGRSVVAFRPTEKALKLLSQAGEHLPEWPAVRERLLNLFDNIKNLNPRKIKEELLEEMSQVELPVVFAAYTIALLIAHIHEINLHGAPTLPQLLQFAPKPELVLSLFAGSVVGTMVKNVKDSLNNKIFSCIHRFLEYISECSAPERKLLAGFLNEALRRSM